MDPERTAPAAPRLGFDRGTIVCDGDGLWSGGGGEVDPAALPGMRWDPRVGRFRAPARCWGAIADQLARAGVPIEDRVLARGRSPRPMRVPELRPYQAAALDAWRLAGRRGVVVLPTGSGKTLVALAAIAGEGRRALCLVPTRVLLDQWRRVIARELGLESGVQGDGERSVAPITVATFESAWRHMAELGDRFELLVIDEVHHFGAGVRDEALEMCIAPLRLGLTATPPEEHAARRLEVLVGPQVFELAVADLAGRWLAELELVELRLDLSLAEREEHDAAWAAFRGTHEEFRDLAPDGSWGDFTRWAARTAQGRAALHGWRRARALLALTDAKCAAIGTLLERHRDARVLVFTADQRAAYRVAREHLVMPITADVKRAERDRALALFEQGELRALVSARVLNEGLDVPAADVGIVAGGALGGREHVQRVGRLLRPAPGKRALVYELVARGTAEVDQARRRRRGLEAPGAPSL